MPKGYVRSVFLFTSPLGKITSWSSCKCIQENLTILFLDYFLQCSPLWYGHIFKMSIYTLYLVQIQYIRQINKQQLIWKQSRKHKRQKKGQNMYGHQIPSDTLRMLRNSESSSPSEHMCIIADTVVMYTKAFDRKLISSRQTLAFACMSNHEAEENETGTSPREEH